MYCRVLPPVLHSPSNRMPPTAAPYNTPNSSQHHQATTAQDYGYIPRAPQNSVASLAVSSMSSPNTQHFRLSGEVSQYSGNSSNVSSALIDRDVYFCSAYDYPDNRRMAVSCGSLSSESQSSLMSIDVDQSRFTDSGSENTSLSPTDVTESCIGVSYLPKSQPWRCAPVHMDNTACSCNISQSECTNLGERPECIGREDLSILYRYNSRLRRGHTNSLCTGTSDANYRNSVIDSDLETDWNDSKLDQSCTTCGDDIFSDSDCERATNVNSHSNSSLCLLSVKPCPINVNKYKLPSFLSKRDTAQQSQDSLNSERSEHTYESIRSRTSTHSEVSHLYKSLRHSRLLSRTAVNIHDTLPENRSTVHRVEPVYDSVAELDAFNQTRITQASDMTQFMQKRLCSEAVTSEMSKSRKKLLGQKLKTVGRYIQQLSKSQSSSKTVNLKTLAYV